MVEGRGEDHGLRQLHLLEDGKADPIGELDIHEQHIDAVGLPASQIAHSRFYTVERADHLDPLAEIMQHPAKPGRRGGFVFYDDDFHARFHTINGMRTVKLSGPSSTSTFLFPSNRYRFRILSSPIPVDSTSCFFFCNVLLTTRCSLPA